LPFFSPWPHHLDTADRLVDARLDLGVLAEEAPVPPAAAEPTTGAAVLGCRDRIDLPRADALLIASSRRATSMIFLR
jgi:hypothetical protein